MLNKGTVQAICPCLLYKDIAFYTVCQSKLIALLKSCFSFLIGCRQRYVGDARLRSSGLKQAVCRASSTYQQTLTNSAHTEFITCFWPH